MTPKFRLKLSKTAKIKSNETTSKLDDANKHKNGAFEPFQSFAITRLWLNSQSTVPIVNFSGFFLLLSQLMGRQTSKAMVNLIQFSRKSGWVQNFRIFHWHPFALFYFIGDFKK